MLESTKKLLPAIHFSMPLLSNSAAKEDELPMVIAVLKRHNKHNFDIGSLFNPAFLFHKNPKDNLNPKRQQFLNNKHQSLNFKQLHTKLSTGESVLNTRKDPNETHATGKRVLGHRFLNPGIKP